MSSVHAAFGLDEVKGKPSMRIDGFVANIEAFANNRCTNAL